MTENSTSDQSAYERGFKDGWSAAIKMQQQPTVPSNFVVPYTPTPTPYPIPTTTQPNCSVCGIVFHQGMYNSCLNFNCPTRVSYNI